MVNKFTLLLYISSAGIIITNNESSDAHYIPFVRAIEFIRKYFQPRLRKEEWNEFKKKVFSIYNNTDNRLKT